MSEAEDAERVYIVLEKCSQRTLHELMRMRKRLSEREAARILLQLVSAVRYLHGLRVIHRDIKLPNLFFHQGACKLGDFGLACRLESEDERRTTLCGTPNYIAPEVLKKGGTGHSYPVDVWSIGVVLFILLVGKPPFDAGGDVKKTYAKVRQAASAGITYPPTAELSPEARDLISALLHPDPSKRLALAAVARHPFALRLDQPPTPGPRFTPLGSAPCSPGAEGAECSLPLGADAASERQARAGRARGEAEGGVASGTAAAAAGSNGVPEGRAQIAGPLARMRTAAGPSAAAHRPLQALSASDAQTAGTAASFAVAGALAAHAGRAIRALGGGTALVFQGGCGGGAKAGNGSGAALSARAASEQAAPPTSASARAESAAQLPAAPAGASAAPTPRAQLCVAPALCTHASAASCVARWCDFSSWYGIGWELLDGTVGASYNDGSRLVLSPGKRRLQYHRATTDALPAHAASAAGEHARSSGGAAASAPPRVIGFDARGAPPESLGADGLAKKLKLLRHFEALLQPEAAAARDASRQLAEGAAGPPVEVYAGDELPHVRRSLRVADGNGHGRAGARVFRLSNRWLQLVFDDGAELLAPLQGGGALVHADGLSGGEYAVGERVPAAAAAAASRAARLLAGKGLATPPALAAAMGDQRDGTHSDDCHLWAREDGCSGCAEAAQR